MDTKTKGKIAENKAKLYLESLGYKIIDNNFYSKFGEIDIIAKKDNIYHFIEVKSGNMGIFNITQKKLFKIIKTINYYIKIKKINLPYQIDAIIINKDIQFIKNISI